MAYGRTWSRARSWSNNEGDHHECATAFALDGDVGGDCYPRFRTTGGARGHTRQYWRAKLFLHPGFLRHMASWEPSLVHTAGVGSRSGDESVADERYWRERLQLAGGDYKNPILQAWAADVVKK